MTYIPKICIYLNQPVPIMPQLMIIILVRLLHLPSLWHIMGKASRWWTSNERFNKSWKTNVSTITISNSNTSGCSWNLQLIGHH
jgi:hypothetical protein